MSEWQNFWSELWSAEWAADTGVPTTITVVGLGVAYQLFKKQLAHDRKLDKQQAERDRKERGRERRIGFASVFAVEARRIAYDLRNIDHEFIRGAGADDVETYVIRARALLNEARRAVDTLTAQLGSGTWSTEVRDTLAVLRYKLQEVVPFTGRLSGSRTSRIRRDRQFVVHSITSRAGTVLDRLAKQFDNWDGEKPIPAFPFKAHERRPVPVGQSMSMRDLMDWMRGKARDFRHDLAQRMGEASGR